MKFACISFTFILCFCFGKTQNCIQNIQDVIKEGIIECTPYPILANGSCNFYTWTVSVIGYNIDFTVDYLELDATAGDYLTISPGSSLIEDDSSIIMTGKIESKKFRVMNNNEMFLKLTTQSRNEESNNLKGFKLSYSPYGKITTSTPSTTSTTTYPTAPSQVDSEAILYIGNITAKEFIEKLDKFKEEMAKMVDIFCKRKNIPTLFKETPVENIIVKLITSCPLGWPKYDKCAKIVLKIPLALNATHNSTYELTGAHIREMWNTMANSYLDQLQFQVYEEPEAQATMMVWVYIAVGIFVVFAAVLIIAWQLNVFNSKRKGIIPHITVGRGSDVSTKSWISETTYEVPPMMYEENLDKPTNQNLPTTPTTTHYDEPRISGPYTARVYFAPKIPYDNPAFDAMGEEITEEKKGEIEDFSSDEESSRPKSHSTKSNQDHLYEAPREADDENYSII